MNGQGSRGAEILLPSRRPHRDSLGRTIYNHAVAVPYTYSETIWKSKTWEMKGVTAEDVQIVSLPLHKDATATLTQSFEDNPIGPFEVGARQSVHPLQ